MAWKKRFISQDAKASLLQFFRMAILQSRMSFCLVEYEDEEMFIVPSSWIKDDNYCYWPKGPDVVGRVQRKENPMQCRKKYGEIPYVKIISRSQDYKELKEKLDTAGDVFTE